MDLCGRQQDQAHTGKESSPCGSSTCGDCTLMVKGITLLMSSSGMAPSLAAAASQGALNCVVSNKLIILLSWMHDWISYNSVMSETASGMYAESPQSSSGSKYKRNVCRITLVLCTLTFRYMWQVYDVLYQVISELLNAICSLTES